MFYGFLSLLINTDSQRVSAISREEPAHLLGDSRSPSRTSAYCEGLVLGLGLKWYRVTRVNATVGLRLTGLGLEFKVRMGIIRLGLMMEVRAEG